MGLLGWIRRIVPPRVTISIEGREFTFRSAGSAVAFFADVTGRHKSEISRMIRERHEDICGYKVRYS